MCTPTARHQIQQTHQIFQTRLQVQVVDVTNYLQFIRKNTKQIDVIELTQIRFESVYLPAYALTRSIAKNQ